MGNDPLGALELTLIEEYLKERGHTLQSARELPDPEGRALLAAAAAYATLHMTEIETRAHYLDVLHGRHTGEP